jgi:hypothetical protein
MNIRTKREQNNKPLPVVLRLWNTPMRAAKLQAMCNFRSITMSQAGIIVPMLAPGRDR